MAKNLSFHRQLVKQIGDEHTNIAADGLNSSEYSGTIDTGAHIFNAGLSGSLFGGMPNNKVLALAGETTTGKTFFALGLVKRFLDDNPDSACIYFDTETAVTKEMFLDRGCDPERIIISEPETVQQFKHRALQILAAYETTPESQRPKMLFVLDSLGQLSTTKEMDDSTAGSDTRDMTRSQQIRSAFRTIRLKAAKLEVPIIVTNHTYEVIGSYVPTKDMSGGGGLKFAADQIVFLSKSKERDKTTKEVIGNVIKIRVVKSRLSRENTEFKVLLTYSGGLDRYYGLVDLAIKHGVFKKTMKKVQLPDGTEVFESHIQKKPENYFTKEILDQLEKAAQQDFTYGSFIDSPPSNTDEEDEEKESEE